MHPLPLLSSEQLGWLRQLRCPDRDRLIERTVADCEPDLRMAVMRQDQIRSGIHDRGIGPVMQPRATRIKNVKPVARHLQRDFDVSTGNRIIDAAQHALKAEFPDLYKNIAFHVPDEHDKRLGQAVVAASLPEI